MRAFEWRTRPGRKQITTTIAPFEYSEKTLASDGAYVAWSWPVEDGLGLEVMPNGTIIIKSKEMSIISGDVDIQGEYKRSLWTSGPSGEQTMYATTSVFGGELTFWLAKVACARAEWLVSGVGVDLAVITSPRPAFRLASHFVGLARHFAQSGLRSPCLGHIFSQNVNILVIAVNSDDEKPYPHASQLACETLTIGCASYYPPALKISEEVSMTQRYSQLNFVDFWTLQCRDVPGNVYFPMASKWRAQAILPDAIKMGVGAACDENSRDSGHYTISGIVVTSNLLHHTMQQGVVSELDSHLGIRTCPMPSQAILPDAIKELACGLRPCRLACFGRGRGFGCNHKSVDISEASRLNVEQSQTYRDSTKSRVTPFKDEFPVKICSFISVGWRCFGAIVDKTYWQQHVELINYSRLGSGHELGVGLTKVAIRPSRRACVGLQPVDIENYVMSAPSERNIWIGCDQACLRGRGLNRTKLAVELAAATIQLFRESSCHCYDYRLMSRWQEYGFNAAVVASGETCLSRNAELADPELGRSAGWLQQPEAPATPQSDVMDEILTVEMFAVSEHKSRRSRPAQPIQTPLRGASQLAKPRG
ncbi:hypothetical protein DFH07DRAFT_781153 [Mycena maculata]|uniref:Uncharacterized protein n=1 Tax=Mycena maculata TaxID=230809 RepID=A0AAD7I162_9AGAR|nr:hypothetical protein DFH07DRAFT_781153 [Mycena maculata]